MMRIVMVMVALIVFVQNVSAQSCATPHYVQPTLRRPASAYGAKEVIVQEVIKEVVAPIAVPVIVPATVFQYLPALAPAVPVTSAPSSVPATPVTPVDTGASAAVGTSTVPAATGSTADIDRVVRERVDAILRERGGDGGPPTLILPGELAGLANAQPTPPAPSAPAPAAQPRDLNQQVASILGSQSCASCHTAGDSPVKGNVTLFVRKEGQLYFQPSVPKKQILAAVTPDASTGRPSMPPAGTTQSASNLNILRQWAIQ